MYTAAEWASAAGRGGGTKHISRLEAIKQAVDRHLEHMALTNPDNTVCTRVQHMHINIHIMNTAVVSLI